MSVESLNVSRFEILMDAGFGAQKAGDILIRAFAKAGKNVYIEPMIPAEISPPVRTKPAMSGVNIRVANFELTNIGNDTDLILASHEIVLDRRLDDQEYNPNAKVLLDMGDKSKAEDSYEEVCKRVAKIGLSLFPFEVSEDAKNLIKKISGRGKNMYYMGMVGKIYNMPKELIIDEIKLTFGARLKQEILDININIFEQGYSDAADLISFAFEIKEGDGRSIEGKKILIDGNTALAMGSIDAGIKVYSGYPITPASSIMHALAKTLPYYGGYVHQAEDEISAIGTAIGAYYGGVPAMTATSGPGLSLKQEFIGYAGAVEVPLIVIDVQRSGPSTGMPTKTEASDLPAVIFGSHGDHTKIVIGVSSITDCFYAPHLARYLTEKLKLPVFIMSEFQTANSYKVIPRPESVKLGDDVNDIPDFILKRFDLKRLPDNIEMVRDLQDPPGTPERMRRITGLNTDSAGKVNYFSETNQRSHAVRNEKVHHVQHALTRPQMFGEKDEGDLLVVGWGSTFGAIQEAVKKCQKEGFSVGGMCFRIVYPLPLMISDIFSKFKKVVTVEMAYGDALKRPPLAMFLRSKTLVDVKPIVSRATGRPISPLTIENSIKEILNGGTK